MAIYNEAYTLNELSKNDSIEYYLESFDRFCKDLSNEIFTIHYIIESENDQDNSEKKKSLLEKIIGIIKVIKEKINKLFETIKKKFDMIKNRIKDKLKSRLKIEKTSEKSYQIMPIIEDFKHEIEDNPDKYPVYKSGKIQSYMCTAWMIKTGNNADDIYTEEDFEKAKERIWEKGYSSDIYSEILSLFDVPGYKKKNDKYIDIPIPKQMDELEEARKETENRLTQKQSQLDRYSAEEIEGFAKNLSFVPRIYAEYVKVININMDTYNKAFNWLNARLK